MWWMRLCELLNGRRYKPHLPVAAVGLREHSDREEVTSCVPFIPECCVSLYRDAGLNVLLKAQLDRDTHSEITQNMYSARSFTSTGWLSVFLLEIMSCCVTFSCYVTVLSIVSYPCILIYLSIFWVEHTCL